MENSPNERGNRIKILREEIMRLSRKLFSERYGIPAGTLQKWEDGIGNGINNHAAEKISVIFQAAGINCHPEWILYGVGAPPDMPSHPSITETTTKQSHRIDELTLISHELQFFYRLHPNALDAIVKDDLMQPYLKQGDYVAGPRYFKDKISTLLHCHCIIQTEDGEILVRKINHVSDQNLYTLTCTHPKKNKPSTHMENINIVSAAPIVWIRRVTPVKE